MNEDMELKRRTFLMAGGSAPWRRLLLEPHQSGRTARAARYFRDGSFQKNRPCVGAICVYEPNPEQALQRVKVAGNHPGTGTA
jgi:hypothetical protein